MSYRIQTGDCRVELPLLADCSVDSVVTDPPYHLTTNKKGGTGLASLNENSPAGRSRVTTGFMGKAWDGGDVAHDPAVWCECLRVLKPGGHLLAFGGSRTYHRLVCAIEDAGFEIRDQIQWLYGSGFPKSLDVSKAIDAAAGVEREIVPRLRTDGKGTGNGGGSFNACDVAVTSGDAITDAAKHWNGWGTALKPAHEPIVLARKPLIGTVAENVLQHGTGAMNIDGCRVEFDGKQEAFGLPRNGYGDKSGGYGFYGGAETQIRSVPPSQGRWPANVIHDGSDEVVSAFPVTASGAMKREVEGYDGESVTGFLRGRSGPDNQHGDAGSAARFFYTSKASKEDRGENDHPTVKPTDLMRYLCRLVTPPNGTVLDPFCGSGSTGRGAVLEGFNFIGIELDAEYCAIAEKRIEAVTRQGILTFA